MSYQIDPLDDAIDHDLDGDCVCGPTDQPVTRGDGTLAWLTVHHALDEREVDQ